MIVQCDGHFDLIHPGHISHLKQASLLRYDHRLRIKTGSLVVTLITGKWMKKKGHPYFTDSERLEHISSLKFVDAAYLIDSPEPYAAIDFVRPDIYVKGLEYEGNLKMEQYLKEKGIEIRYIGRKIYGSTTLALESGLA